MPLRGASQCQKSMSDQLAHRQVWQRYMLSTGTLSLALPVKVLPSDSGATTGSQRIPENCGGPLHLPLRAVRPAKKDVLASQRIIGKGLPQVSQLSIK